MDAQEKDLLRQNVREVLAAADGGQTRGAVEEFGWAEFLAEEPASAVEIFSSMIGELLSPSVIIDDVLVSAADMSLPAGTAVVYPRAASAAPTSELLPGAEGHRLLIDGIVRIGAAPAETVLVPAVCEGSPALVVVRGGLEWPSSAAGLDEESGWAPLRAEVLVPAAEAVTGADALTRWLAVRAAGHRALAHEMVGVGRAILRLTLEHTTSREQFGKPLAALQVVKHKLADIRLWEEPAALAAEAAWEDETPESAMLAKLLAARFLETARVNGQQLLGGMGFTWEHPFHRYLKRALLLESLLGSAAALRVELGSGVRDATVPPLALL